MKTNWISNSIALTAVRISYNSAGGEAMPPLLIVKGKTEVSETKFATFLGSPSTKLTHQMEGWTDNSLGVEWFKQVFIPNCGQDRPVLLLLDSHSSHKVLELLELVVEQNTRMFTLPPHTTQCLQPLDTNIFPPLRLGIRIELLTSSSLSIQARSST